MPKYKGGPVRYGSVPITLIEQILEEGRKANEAFDQGARHLERRDTLLTVARAHGASVRELAAFTDLSPQRIHQITRPMTPLRTASDRLTSKEAKVLELLANGVGPDMGADQMQIDPLAFRNLVRSILAKLGKQAVRDRLQTAESSTDA